MQRRFAAALLIQRMARGFHVRARYRYAFYSAALIQHTFRAWWARMRGALSLQRLFRGHKGRARAKQQRSAVVLQARARTWLAIRVIHRLRRAAEAAEVVRRKEEEMNVRAARFVLGEEMEEFLETKKGKAQVNAEASALRATLSAQIAAVRHKVGAGCRLLVVACPRTLTRRPDALVCRVHTA